MDLFGEDMSEYMKYVGGATGAVTLGVVAAAGAYYLSRGSKPYVEVSTLKQQSYEVPGVPYARASRFCKDGEFLETMHEEVTTAYEAFVRGARESENGDCIGRRESKKSPFKWISYNDVLLRSSYAGAGLIYKGLPIGNDSRVGIYSQNRPEYVISELGCHSYSMVPVPLYDTLGPEACTYILNQAEVSVIFCDKNEKTQLLLNHKKATPGLRLIIIFDEPTDETIQLAEEMGVELLTLRELEVLGDKHPIKLQPPTPDDLYVICYTSGTTGSPKGAMITQRNVIACASGIEMALKSVNFCKDDTLISYLPLAHMYERVTELLFFTNGGRVGYYGGDVRILMEDIKHLKPTIFPTVPRLLNRIYDKVMDSVNSSVIKKCLFKQAMSSKMNALANGVIQDNTIWDKIVFKKVQEALGGNCRAIACGSAPLSSRVMNFMRCASGCPVVEGYGQTESAAVATVQLPGDDGAGHVGPPLPCNWLKVVDVPEMKYFADNHEGEVCVKGPNVFQGYLNQPKKTAEVLDADGWLHTGDIGRWLPNGVMKIIDRKKHIFKLAQGEYIAPEKIENVYIRSPAISQMFIHGDSLKACLVGVCVPDPDIFQKWVKDKLGRQAPIQELCKDEVVKKAILDDLTTVAKKAGLHSFEQVKDIMLYPGQFSVENGLLTPTFKSKRQELRKYFADEIEKMYANLS